MEFGKKNTIKVFVAQLLLYHFMQRATDVTRVLR